MDSFIKKQNIPNINPSTTIKTSETKPLVQESGGNFFEVLAKSNTMFSWTEGVESQISKVKRQTQELENILNTGSRGTNLNIIG